MTGPILAKILECISAHGEKEGEGPDAETKKSEEELKEFDEEFVKVDLSTLFQIIVVRFKALYSVSKP